WSCRRLVPRWPLRTGLAATLDGPRRRRSSRVPLQSPQFEQRRSNTVWARASSSSSLRRGCWPAGRFAGVVLQLVVDEPAGEGHLVVDVEARAAGPFGGRGALGQEVPDRRPEPGDDGLVGGGNHGHARISDLGC